jgi:hypothetical protein
MGLWLVVVETTASPHHNGTLGTLEWAHLTTLRTGLILTQPVGLPKSGCFQGPGQQRPHSRHRHLFHLIEVDIQTRTLLAPMSTHDDFSPLLGQSRDPLDIF